MRGYIKAAFIFKIISTATEKHPFQIILEQINEKLALLADAVLSLGERMTRVEHRLDVIEQKLDHIPPLEVVVSEYEERITVLERKAA